VLKIKHRFLAIFVLGLNVMVMASLPDPKKPENLAEYLNILNDSSLDVYKKLGLNKNEYDAVMAGKTKEEQKHIIKKYWRSSALLYHPDKNSEFKALVTEIFQKITSLIETLDPDYVPDAPWDDSNVDPSSFFYEFFRPNPEREERWRREEEARSIERERQAKENRAKMEEAWRRMDEERARKNQEEQAKRQEEQAKYRADLHRRMQEPFEQHRKEQAVKAEAFERDQKKKNRDHYQQLLDLETKSGPYRFLDFNESKVFESNASELLNQACAVKIANWEQRIIRDPEFKRNVEIAINEARKIIERKIMEADGFKALEHQLNYSSSRGPYVFLSDRDNNLRDQILKSQSKEEALYFLNQRIRVTKDHYEKHPKNMDALMLLRYSGKLNEIMSNAKRVVESDINNRFNNAQPAPINNPQSKMSEPQPAPLRSYDARKLIKLLDLTKALKSAIRR
jgi:hypothetical protein